MNMKKEEIKIPKFNIFKLPLIVIGLLFLSNPIMGLVDLLPDFIGYFLLILGLDGVKRLNGDIEYGVGKLKYLCVISVIAFIFMFYTFKMDSSWILTLTFSYMSLSVIFGLNACNDIFNGIDYLTDRHGSEGFPSAYEPKIMTKIYIIVKAALVTIPQLYALVETAAKGELDPNRDYLAILATKKYAVVVCALFSICIAIAWLKYVIKYCIAFKKDEALISKLKQMYVNDYSKDGIPINFWEISFGSGMILVSHVFIYDFVLDTVHFLPEFLSIAISLVGIITIRKYLDVKGLWKYAVPALLVHVFLFFYRNKFVENVIIETNDITLSHLIISSLIAFGYIFYTYMYFSILHKKTSDAYENMFGWISTEVYEWGDIFFLIALCAGGANIICPVWRPYFIPVMIVSIVAAMYNYTKIYTKFGFDK